MKHKFRVSVGELVCFAFALLFSFWLMFHTFSYDGASGSMLVGRKVWSDFSQHIPVIRSFSYGANLLRLFGPGAVEFPLFPGETIRYHFLFYAFVGLLEKLDLRIDWALNLPSALGFAGLLVAIWLLAKRLFKNVWVAGLSVLFFLFNGSFAFLRFFEAHGLKDILSIREFPAFAPWGPGPVSAFWTLNVYTNQRHLAAAFAMILVFILWVLAYEKRTLKKQVFSAILWGMLFGLFPFFHQPSLLILGVLLVCYVIVFPRMRIALIFTGLVTAAIAIPQIIPLLHGGVKTVSWYVGYLMHDNLSVWSFLTYWWHNLGLHAVLIPIGFFILPRRAKYVLFPLFIIFIGANLFKFSVEVAASHKFFNFALILGNMISASVIVRLAQKLKRAGAILAALLVIVLTFSGIIDFFVVANDTRGRIPDVQTNEASRWIAQNTPRDAVFLNSGYLYQPASLAGRSIFLGWPYFAWSAGYPEDRMPIMDRMYESKDPVVFCGLLREYNISYVTVEHVSGDADLPTIDEQYFFKNFSPVYRSGEYGIFSVEELCRGISSVEG